MLPIALQLYSIRNEVEADFRGTMEKIKEMGYEGVESAAGFGNTPIAEAKQILDEVGLTLVSAHFSRYDLANEELLQEYKEIGLQYAVLASLRDRTPEEGVTMIREMAENCQKLGLTLMYHNHDFEFATVDGGYILDKYYDEISPELLLPEIDTCWVKVAGVDPAEYVKKYSGRQEVVHLKDFVGSKSANMYGLIGEENKEKKDTEAGKFELRPVGYGIQDVPSIIVASQEAGAKWLIVEQDKPSMGKTPMECAKMSIDYLKSLNI